MERFKDLIVKWILNRIGIFPEIKEELNQLSKTTASRFQSTTPNLGYLETSSRCTKMSR